MKQLYVPKDARGWTYYIDSYFAWVPMYCQGTFCWLQQVWFTWPEKADGTPVLVKDVLDEKDLLSMFHNQDNKEMYKAYFPYDPRKK